MRGWVEIVQDGRIEGWIVDDETGRDDLVLHVFVGARKIAEVPVTRPRPDIAEAAVLQGMAGFALPFTAADHLNLSCAVRVYEARTGWLLPPGAIAFDPGADPVAAHELGLLEPRIAERIDRIDNLEQLQREAMTLARQFGRAVDRAQALAGREQEGALALRAAVLASGGLGATLSHAAAALRDKYPPLVFDAPGAPLVSVIVPVRDQFALTYACLAALYAHPQQSPFEILLVDDLSSDETLLAALVFLGAVRVLRNARNLGFGASCNAGAAVARGEYLYFLNNDTLAEANWLDPLVECFGDPKVGVAGARLLNADRTVQDCGGLVWNDGSAWNWGRNAGALHPDYRFRRPADYVSGAALMTRASLFRKLGGFDPLYEPAYYEDTDYCFRARAAGASVVVQPAATLVHLEGGSNGVDTSLGLKRYQTINQLKFARRWRDELRRRRSPGAEPRAEAMRHLGSTVLFVDDAAPTPDRDAGSIAALEHMRALMRMGHHVIFAPTEVMADIPPYTAVLERLGVECVYAPFFWSLDDFLRRRQPKLEWVYLHRFPNADRFLALVRQLCPEAKIIYSVADLHSLRQARQREVDGGAPARPVAPEREFELIAAADVALVHSSAEWKLVRERAPAANVHCVAWPVLADASPPGFAERQGVAFVGGFEHEPNIDAAVWYASDIHPRLLRLAPEIRARLFGSSMPDKVKALAGPGLEPVGYVEDLRSLLRGVRATVAPLRFGAGIKGKVLSSLACGAPCVMTPIAAEGLDLPEALAPCIAETPDAFAATVARIVRDEWLWRHLSQAGLAYIRDRYSTARIDAALRAALGPPG